MPKNRPRLLWVDTVRGLAIVLMVIFHFCYDLRYFEYVDWLIPNGSGWRSFRYVILTLFIFTVGVSLSLAHCQKINLKAFNKRLSQLIGSAIAVTIMSLFLFPNTWIYFGILHFIALASLLGLPLITRPRLAIAIGIALLVSYWLGLLKSQWPFALFNHWLPKSTEDFVPLFPWLGIMYIGIGSMGVMPKQQWDLPDHRTIRLLQTIGQHGLLIYLIHQPILFTGFLLIKALN